MQPDEIFILPWLEHFGSPAQALIKRADSGCE